MLLLVLALLLAACNPFARDNDDDDDDDRRPAATAGLSVRADADADAVADADAEADAVADADTDAEADADADADTDAEADAEAPPDPEAPTRRLAELNIPLPGGATLGSAPHLDARDIQLRYTISGMSPAQILAFYAERLPRAGYEISDQDDEEIEFGGSGLLGEIEVDERDGRSEFEIDLDLQ